MSESITRLVQAENDAKDFGFYWENPEMILDQAESECAEIREVLVQGESRDRLQEEIGDLIHIAMSLCVYCELDVQETLDKATAKFSKRMAALKEITYARGLPNLQHQETAFMMGLWDEMKQKEEKNLS